MGSSVNHRLNAAPAVRTNLGLTAYKNWSSLVLIIREAFLNIQYLERGSSTLGSSKFGSLYPGSHQILAEWRALTGFSNILRHFFSQIRARIAFLEAIAESWRARVIDGARCIIKNFRRNTAFSFWHWLHLFPPWVRRSVPYLVIEILLLTLSLLLGLFLLFCTIFYILWVEYWLSILIPIQ